MRKGKLIAGSILSIIMCSSLIAGATYALFTSDSTVNIAISSGKVQVNAYTDNLTGSTTYASDEKNGVLNDDLGAYSGYYKTETIYTETNDKGASVITFANGGEATLSGGTVTLDRITPGDSVAFDIIIENKSNVATQYRTSMTAVTKNEDTTNGRSLMSALNLKITTDESTSYKLADERTSFDAMESYVSAWRNWSAVSKTKEKEEYTVHVEISLPLETMNEYQNLATEITFKIEAVQGNAHTTGSTDIFRSYKVENVDQLDSILESANASDNSVNIDLTDDINLTTDLTNPLTISGSTKNPNKTTVINLGEQTLTNTYETTTMDVAGSAINVTNGANLVVENGSIETNFKNNSQGDGVINKTLTIFDVGSSSELLLKNVSITSLVNGNDDSVVYAEGVEGQNAVVKLEDVTMNLGAGTNDDTGYTQNGYGIIAKGYSSVLISGDNTDINVTNRSTFLYAVGNSNVEFESGTITTNSYYDEEDEYYLSGQGIYIGESATAKLDKDATLNVNGGEGVTVDGYATCTVEGLKVNISFGGAIMSYGQTIINDIYVVVDNSNTDVDEDNNFIVVLDATGKLTKTITEKDNDKVIQLPNIIINKGTFKMNATSGMAFVMLSASIHESTDDVEVEDGYTLYDSLAGSGYVGYGLYKANNDSDSVIVEIIDSIYNFYYLANADF